MSRKVAVVTGGNTGLGLAIVRGLCKQLGDQNAIVYLTSRSEERGQQGLETLKEEGLGPRLQQLDVSDVASMERLRDFIKKEHGGLDILVNNAGIAYKGNDIPMSEQAAGTIRTNYYGMNHMTRLFLPLMRDGGRIVHISSQCADMAFPRLSVDLQKRFREVSSEQEVNELMDEFVAATKTGNHVEKGWPDWAYGVSKLGVVALTKMQGRNVSKDSSKKDVLINCCCPGYVATNMTAHHGSERLKKQLTPDQGADAPLYLALLPPGTTGLQGKYLSKRQVNDFLD